MSSGGVRASAWMPSAAWTRGWSSMRFSERECTPPPSLSSVAVVVLPRRAGQVVQPGPLGQRGLRIGVGVEEHVAVVERGEQAEARGQQHAVAEHVARHVADADGGERVGGDVEVELAEVAVDRHPRAAGRDAEGAVVVADRATGRERVAEPVGPVDRDAVGDVAERGGALVRRDDQVRVVLRIDEVEQAPDERLVGDPHRFRVGPLRRTAEHEPALRPGGHDQRVLQHLGAHQVEHLGPQVLGPVAVADAAAGHRPGPQVDALDRRAVDEDLAVRAPGRARRARPRSRAPRRADPPAARPGWCGWWPRPCRPGRGGCGRGRGARPCRRPPPARRAARSGSPSPPPKRARNSSTSGAGDVGVLHEHLVDVAGRVAGVDLAPVAAVGPEDRHVGPRHPGRGDQPVQGIGVGPPLPERDQRVGHAAPPPGPSRTAEPNGRTPSRWMPRSPRSQESSSTTQSPRLSRIGSRRDSSTFGPALATVSARTPSSSSSPAAPNHASQPRPVELRELVEGDHVGGRHRRGHRVAVATRAAGRPRRRRPCGPGRRGADPAPAPAPAPTCGRAAGPRGRPRPDRRAPDAPGARCTRKRAMVALELPIDSSTSTRVPSSCTSRKRSMRSRRLFVYSSLGIVTSSATASASGSARTSTRTRWSRSSDEEAAHHPVERVDPGAEQLVLRQRLEQRGDRLLVVAALHRVLALEQPLELPAQQRDGVHRRRPRPAG